ncbi:MAG: DUF2807 domain-containing protein [Pseudomonadota bacterium]
MTKSLLIGAASAALFAAPAFGDTQTFDLDGFSKIKAERAVNVVFEQGDYSVVAETAGDDFSQLKITIDGDVLVVSRPGKWRDVSIRDRGGEKVIKVNGKRVPTYTVRVSAPMVDGLSASTSSDLEAFNLDVADLEAKASSSGDVTLSGRCMTLTAKASSSGDVIGESLTCNTAVVSASSSGDVMLQVDGGDVVAKAASSGDVLLKGTCANLTAQASSSGDVEAEGLVCANGSLKASSSGDIIVGITERATATASSSGDIEILGSSAIVNATESSGGDVTVGG